MDLVQHSGAPHPNLVHSFGAYCNRNINDLDDVCVCSIYSQVPFNYDLAIFTFLNWSLFQVDLFSKMGRNMLKMKKLGTCQDRKSVSGLNNF